MESESSSVANGRTTWTPPMDQLFIELMVEQVVGKQLLDGQFSKIAWVSIVTKFKESFGPSFNKEVLKNRMKTLKKNFNVVSSLRGQSGFGWNDEKEIVTTPDVVWSNHIEKHPECKQWRTRSLPQYNELAMIFGDSRATGKYSRFRDDNNRDNNEVDEDRDDNTEDQNENPEDHNENTYGNGNVSDDNTSEPQKNMRTSIGSSSRSFRKTKKSTGEGMVEAISLMASVVNNIATKKEENRNSSLEKSVVVALEEIVPELDDFLFMQGLELLEDEKKAKIFIALSGDRRRRWLLSKINYSDYY
ncbi:hypothetical protein C5167_034557 [Papaver somniferum]|uniref:Myb/SANT-like domain-containing protein n=1 Tax=Papaver somniferum TaxID=3469 RepID=A0A4Y7KEV6_PAPSO|nr:hypothetical protein C5167_034557 [Papaver somniferum]